MLLAQFLGTQHTTSVSTDLDSIPLHEDLTKVVAVGEEGSNTANSNLRSYEEDRGRDYHTF